MRKSDLIDHIAAEAELTKADAGRALDAVLGGITATLAAGDEVAITGFGTFSSVERAAREGRNPRTGETVPIAASRAVKFKVGKALKDSVK